MTLVKDHPSCTYSFHPNFPHIDPVSLDMIQNPGPLSNYEYKQFTFYFLTKNPLSVS